MPDLTAAIVSADSPGRPSANSAGIGLKAKYYQEVIQRSPPVGWFEVHPENYMVDGGPPLRYLETIRRDYPLSLHGVGMSLGSCEPPPPDHLDRLAVLIDRFQPFAVSEHLSWSRTGDSFLADLLPLPMTSETLRILEANVCRAQDRLQRTLLIENPSAYLRFAGEDIPEPEFLSELAQRTGCGLLLDVNNLFVSASNQDFAPNDWLDAFDLDAVGEIHLAGHSVNRASGHTIRIDDHGSPVIPDVWDLYRQVITRRGATPTLIERDSNLPPLGELVAEARQAELFARQALECRQEAPHEVADITRANHSATVGRGAGAGPILA